MPNLNNPEAPGTMMQPEFFLTGDKIPFGTPDAERRSQLAKWLTGNEWFATALANRMWAELVGEGFYSAVDDIGPEREPTAPTAIKVLSSKFAANDYDVKWLIKTICLTDTYCRESRSRHLTGEPPFTANIPQRLRSDQLLNSLLTALEVDEELPRRQRPQARIVSSIRARFDDVFGYDPSLNREDAVSSIPQVLALMNSPDVNKAINGRTGHLVEQLLQESPGDDELTTELFLRCLSREPTAEELATIAEYRTSSKNRRQAYEDVVWSLLNSTEFQHRP